MLILGFESSCDETAIAVLAADEEGNLRILSSKVASQVETHRLYGGVVPEIASRAHIEAISGLLTEALTAAEVALKEIDLIAVTNHPGLIGALLVAVNFAKGLAVANHIPLVAVDHIKGHVAAIYPEAKESVPPPRPPFLAVLTSGGHTGIYHVVDYTDYRLIGTTRDDAIGESFDKIGRKIGIPYPAGAGFDRLAREGFTAALGDGEGDLVSRYRKLSKKLPKEQKLPSPALAGDTLDLSFSGLKTAAINFLHRCESTGVDFDKAAFAAEYTFEAVEAVAEKVEAALALYPGMPLVLAGGVAANSHLRKRLATAAKEAGSRLFLPPLSLCGDNGAMIAAQGYYEYLTGHTAGSDLNAFAADE